MYIGRSLVVLVGLLGASDPALAQALAPPDAPATDVSRQGGTLSDKLSNSGGVIHPQGGIDGDIEKAPAVESRMPVIPPGTSSGAGRDGVAK